MNARQADLYARLEAFSIDEGEVVRSFTSRLAEENGWSEEYARRVIVEYKRFLFLAMTAGHSVTPSEAVDQAWHLHLCYTRSYWGRLCGEVLGRPLHHNPTEGGVAELRKHVSWYRRTQASYERAFGRAAPADVWPEASVRFGTNLCVRRVNVRDNLIVPRAWVKWGATSAVAVVLGALALAGWHPFALNGTGFLAFYGLALFALALFGVIARQRYEQPDDQPTEEGEVLTPCDLGYLANGKIGATNVAITTAVGCGALRHQADQLVVGGKLPERSEALERAVIEAVADGAETISEVRRQVSDQARRHESTLVELGLLPRPARRWRGWLFAVSPLLVLLVLGMIRLGRGLERGRSVGGLLLLLALTFVAMLTVSYFKRFRTGRGERLLGQLRHQYDHLKTETDATPALLGLGVGLFGVDCLRGGPHEALGTGLGSSAGGQGSGCGGGCGGGGCGGCGGG